MNNDSNLLRLVFGVVIFSISYALLIVCTEAYKHYMKHKRYRRQLELLVREIEGRNG